MENTEIAMVGETKELNGSEVVITLKKPFEYTGMRIEALVLDFESLTGEDMIKIESEMQATGQMAWAPELSQSLQCKLAARAAGVGSDVIEHLPLKEFNAVTSAVRSFLLNMD